MNKLSVLVFFFISEANLFAQQVNYSPAFFGPNALPVPEFTDATIAEHTTVSVSGNYFFGFGDQAINPRLEIDVPLLAQRISLKLWVDMWEYYKVTPAIYAERQMQGELSGSTHGGDIYVQTRISIFSETRCRPAVVLNSTLRSASGGEFDERRYFDTPGYYFDVEAAKSFLFNSNIISNLRFAADVGFLCWETTNSTQNDALMAGGKIILSNKKVDFENSLSGYKGWMRNGDNPLVFNSKLTGKFHYFNLFAQYKYGIRDWHYHQIQAGISFTLPRLTPKY